jgi:hypothetical protein
MSFLNDRRTPVSKASGLRDRLGIHWTSPEEEKNVKCEMKKYPLLGRPFEGKQGDRLSALLILKENWETRLSALYQ